MENDIDRVNQDFPQLPTLERTWPNWDDKIWVSGVNRMEPTMYDLSTFPIASPRAASGCGNDKYAGLDVVYGSPLKLTLNYSYDDVDDTTPSRMCSYDDYVGQVSNSFERDSDTTTARSSKHKNSWIREINTHVNGRWVEAKDGIQGKFSKHYETEFKYRGYFEYSFDWRYIWMPYDCSWNFETGDGFKWRLLQFGEKYKQRNLLYRLIANDNDQKNIVNYNHGDQSDPLKQFGDGLKKQFEKHSNMSQFNSWMTSMNNQVYIQIIGDSILHKYYQFLKSTYFDLNTDIYCHEQENYLLEKLYQLHIQGFGNDEKTRHVINQINAINWEQRKNKINLCGSAYDGLNEKFLIDKRYDVLIVNFGIVHWIWHHNISTIEKYFNIFANKLNQSIYENSNNDILSKDANLDKKDPIVIFVDAPPILREQRYHANAVRARKVNRIVYQIIVKKFGWYMLPSMFDLSTARMMDSTLDRLHPEAPVFYELTRIMFDILTRFLLV